MTIQTFLSELYELDASLREHETELIPIIETLMQRDPAVSPDATFVTMLRTQLRERSHSLSSSSMSLLQKLSYVFGGAVTATVIALIVVFRPVGQPSGMNNHENTHKLFPYTIQDDGKKAFGSLQTMQTQTGHAERTQSGGGGSTTPSVPPMGMAGGGGGAPGMDAKMMAPYSPTQFTYVYSGELSDLADSVDVFKRDPSLTHVSFDAIADSLHLGTVDLSSFRSADIDSINLTQKEPFGYQVYVNLHDGSVGISQQWEQWPQSKCQTDACYQAERVKPSEVPSDEELIAIAKKFAGDHGVDLSHYGEPKIDASFGPVMMPLADGMRAPEDVPEAKRVIFPLLLDGKETYDQSGLQTGINMGVNLKYRRVTDVYGLSSQTYRKSSYAGVTDASIIQKFIAQVDSYYGGEGADVKNVTVTLGTPSVGLVTYYRYANNTNEELLVPSLVFPVEHVDGDQQPYRRSVVVPLAQELLSEQLDQQKPINYMEGVPTPPPNVKAE